MLCYGFIIVLCKIPPGAAALVDFNIPPMTMLSLVLPPLRPGLVHHRQNEWLCTGQEHPCFTQLNLRNQKAGNN